MISSIVVKLGIAERAFCTLCATFRLIGIVSTSVAAASSLDDFDPFRTKRVEIHEDVRSAAVAPDPDSQDVRMLDEQQRIADATGAAILDERALQLERLGVGNEAEITEFHVHCSRVPTRITPVGLGSHLIPMSADERLI